MATHDNFPSLLADARAGLPAARETILTGARDRLERFVATRLSAALRGEAEDVVQETLLRATASLERFSGADREALVRWLHGIAEHVILDLARREKLRRGRVLRLEVEAAADDPSPSRLLRRQERFERLRTAIDRLEPKYREAIRLVRLEGLSVAAAAARLGRTPKSVAHLLARGLERLREDLGDTESLRLPPERLDGKEPRHGER